MSEEDHKIIEATDLLDHIVALSREAGRRIMAIYATDFNVQHKADESPLTAADMAAHEVISEGLKLLTPEIPILSEESVEIPFAERSQWSKFWLVDPLDGTREFVKRNGEFTVNIALIDDHEPVLGVIHVPVTEVSYFAARGQGAYKQTAGDRPVIMHVRARPDDKLTIAGSRSHGSKMVKVMAGHFGEVELIVMGSSLKSCLVAEGTADLYPRFGPTSEWDTAAAQAIVEVAGGALTDTQLRPLRYNTKESLINPSFLVYGDMTIDWRRYLPATAPPGKSRSAT